MAGNDLIDEYAAGLSNRLPEPIVEELLDGLAETYRSQMTMTADSFAAAKGTIAEFGDPDAVVRAFIHDSPGHRLAKALLVTGPLVGLGWASVLVISRAWDWPIPLYGRLVFGLSLVVAMGALLSATLNREQLQRSRMAARTGAMTLVALDATLISAALVLAQRRPLLLFVAISASSLRITFTMRRLPQLLRA